MGSSNQEVRSSYQSTAKYYDFAVKWFYQLIGIRAAYRLRAIKLLRLKRGDYVVELGCGTGLNFPFIIEQIGPEGRLIGVDISSNMLTGAREMVERSGWKNVELVESDIVAYKFPKGVNGILSVGVFGYITDSDSVIKAALQSLVPSGRLAIMDGKQPDRLPFWVFNLIVRVSRPYGVIRDYFYKRTWESVERYFRETAFEEMYGGMLYISSGTAS